MSIPFNKPYVGGKELWNIAQSHARGQMAGDGGFTKQCQVWLQERAGSRKALLAHSCTASLEMAAILADVRPCDEVVMPSYTFVSTANAFALRGAMPVFVDIRSDTLNLDERLLEEAITERTKAICPVHYAGVGCEMDSIMAIADRHGLMVIEDAAQGVLSNYRGCALGGLGHLGAFSFHETKNIISGEGGALLVNDPALAERAEIIREKGTNRSQFFRGQVDKYTWVDIGSSYLPGEIIAAFLLAQMEEADAITARRLAIWDKYHAAFEALEQAGRLRRPIIPEECEHNAHMYYLLLRDLDDRSWFIDAMKQEGIQCVFHYVPLHSAPYGRKIGRTAGELPVTDDIAERLVRLPLWLGLEDHQDRVIEMALRILERS
ncbi:MAG: dTDP-4-amino-4,6-dideoxygalactose transaminase [Desulfuromonadales bacterium]|nr:dTDP-4-amino-4,6-dideoxygalactose transaminase [Desulfuromonadales bacterium]